MAIALPKSRTATITVAARDLRPGDLVRRNSGGLIEVARTVRIGGAVRRVEFIGYPLPTIMGEHLPVAVLREVS